MDVRRRRGLWWRVGWTVVVGIFAVLGFALTVATGREDSALLFVGLPAGLALLLALSPAPHSLHGTVFVSVTIFVLLFAALLQEGAICLLMAAPLVYAIAHGVAGLVQLFDRGVGVALVLPLLALVAIEGVVPTLRISPVQAVTVTRQTALTPAEVQAAVAAGPRFGSVRPLLLRLGYPTPDHAAGRGVDVGGQWHIGQHGGAIVTEVVANEPYRDGRRIDFRRVSDTSMTNHSLIWRTARLSWSSAPGGGTDVRLTIEFERRLDPSWYFGPIVDSFARAGENYLLDSLGLEPA
ncbi:SRPBCC family protein [Cryptosporangium aurantiacum]|uniref:Polyketide cyclase / dehydrase and lipid transport n=1 Tax=Cryptosporangium aurantiacum TaxID=134849 RepID=A0A1M7NB79_9ACTN|nr:SRPBCC family protein [Cryptosporangium aurantiacum]SHN00740.1 Polyketide cyclase / dehydrase and lipid transport [Cryptosporangium aurantiacum]